MERADVGKDLIRMVFSWSTKDILNNDLYEHKVKQIPRTFFSTIHYLNSFVFPLIEETRADLCSSLKTVAEAPACEITEIGTSKDYNPPYDLFYNLELEPIEDSEKEGETFEPETGDLIALSYCRPTRIDDLTRPGDSYVIALVQRVKKKLRNENIRKIQILASKPINFEVDLPKVDKRVYGFAVYLVNMTTNMRIWNALRSDPEGRGMRILKKVLQPDSSLGENCVVCFSSEKYNIDVSSLGAVVRSLDLNRSQEETVISCIATRECSHKNTVKLIWGPPGTGKTKTVSSLLFALLKRKCRTLTCTPTNVAVLEVTSRLLRLVMESLQYHTYGLGDIVLFGNGERMKIDTHDDLFDVFLDYRAHILAKCFAPLSGWKHNLELMICLLENPQKQYLLYLDSQEKRGYDKDDDDDDSMRELEMELRTELNQQNNQGKKDAYSQDPIIFNQSVWKKIVIQTLRENKKLCSEERNRVKYEKEENKVCLFENNNNIMDLTFSEFVKKEFSSIRMQMRTFVVNMCTHLPTSIISLRVVKWLFECLDLLKVFGTLLSSNSVSEKEYELALATSDDGHRFCSSTWESKLCITRKDCLKKLKSLQNALVLPDFFDEHSIKSFCLKRARLVFCTVSSSARLLVEELDTLEMLVVDEAAQLKECESTIPLQLPGLRHVVLFGDEKQLPALVKSEISDKGGFGRSLFERLVLLGHEKHLLNVQYRMHPSISLFPNTEFYDEQILDSPSVKDRCYEKCFLHGDMFKPYSFLNVAGQDELDERGSHKNVVEVSVVSEIVLNLFKESVSTRQTLSVGVISPYKAQVFAIEEKLGKKFGEDFDNFSLKISSVDGFQGGEEDVIIISTVRCNGMGLVGFLSSNQRTNVAITRARHCLWIVGNGETLMNSSSVWERLVLDAMARGCYHNADDDERLSYAITTALIELDQMDNLLDINSLLFRKARWKVCFCHDFLKSMEINKSAGVRKNVYSLLMQISSGWRQPHHEINIVVVDDICAQPLELYKINELLYLVWTIDIIQEKSNYIQALKMWDILPLSEVAKLARDIDIWYRKYPIDVLKCCRLRCSDGNFEVPLTWLCNTSNPNYYYLPQADLQLVCDQLDSFGLTDV